jgi:hypothetical protein
VTPAPPTEHDIARWARDIRSAHKNYQEASDKLLAYARHGTDPRVLIERLQAVVETVDKLTRVCEAVPASLGLLRGEQFPGIITINEEDIHDLQEEAPG